MSFRVVVRPEAEADIMEAAAWYRDQRADLDAEFLKAVRVAIQRAGERPLAWRLMRREPHVRRILTDRFPYRIFYVVGSDAVIVFAAVHNKRNDQIWSDRL